MSLRKLQMIIVFLFIPLGAVYWYADSKDIDLSSVLFPGTSVVHLGDIPVRVEIADTPLERKAGLSGRKELTGVDGLFFIFEESGYHGIWMKDMRFPIDVIWIDDDLKIIEITESLIPESYPKVYEPSRPARYVIETNPHFAESFGIRVGDTLWIPNKLLR